MGPGFDGGFPADPLEAGVDEVGRGCLFGPVFAGAVILPQSSVEPLRQLGLTDSKALSARRRAALVPVIQALASAWALGQSTSAEIDRLGIRLATERAMHRALQKLPLKPELVLVDGVLPLREWSGDQRTLVQGDRHCLAIAAASVLAKQARDSLVSELFASRFPGYGLERHMGYATRQHREALLRLGATPLHRRSFLRRLSLPDTSGCSRPAADGPPGP
ncbi:MAG: ribonuclease HII [Cyanobacteriota bacterium]|nr:ribonuclease HII [Cyanobacteriota bacterium]